MGRSKQNLVLVGRNGTSALADFKIIADIIKQRAPDIRPFVIKDRPYNIARADVLFQPTLTVATRSLKKYRALRGAVTENRLLLKSQEYEILESAGVPVPKWALVSEQNPKPDLTGFTDYVVTKPDCGGRGAGVKIKRRGRVRWKPPQNDRALKLGENDVIAQDFVYTGNWPISYRVTTLFGKVLFAWKVTAATERRALLGPDRFSDGAGGGGMSICSSGKGCTFELIDDADVLELGRQAHAAFPDYPLLGFDIVREVPSGKLSVLEANTCGQLWHFTSKTGKSIQIDNQIDFIAQFDGYQQAADALIEETRKRAA